MIRSRQKTKTARQIALAVLNKFDTKNHDSKEVLYRFIEQTDQKAQTTDIVYGVIRNLIAIDMVITNAAELPKERIKSKILNILRIGTYELIYSSQTAEYAIVNEAVNLANDSSGKKTAGFVNAVLRNITRMITDRSAEITNANIRKVLPKSETHGCLFKCELLPDPDDNIAIYLSKAYSLPKWLIEKWICEFGPDKCRKICIASNRRPGIYITPNTLKTTTEQLAEILSSEGIENINIIDNSTIRIAGGRSVTTINAFNKGLFIIQDPTAAGVAQKLKPRPGQTIIDLCAAPGGKTVQMAQIMKNNGRIIATDIDDKRLQRVDENCKRLGISIVNIIKYSNFKNQITSFYNADAVMLDVPCSNTGVLARRPEVRLRIKKDNIEAITQTQYELIERAGNLIRPGGKICYSTCSILKEENSEIVKRFLSNHGNFILENQQLVLPSYGTDEFDYDGGFVSIICKKT